MPSKETRAFKCELRVEEKDGKPTVFGLAVPYNQLSLSLATESGTRFREQFLPGAFADSLARGVDVRGSVEHDRRTRLGRSTKGTLQAIDREDGLYVQMALPDTTLGRDTLEDVRNGNLDGMSIEFLVSPEGEDMRFTGGEWIRSVRAAELHGVTLTNSPAYPQTAGTVMVRSLDALEEKRKASEAKAAQDAERERRAKLARARAVEVAE